MSDSEDSSTLSNTTKIILIVITVIMVLGLVIGGYFIFRTKSPTDTVESEAGESSKKSNNNTTNDKVKPTTILTLEESTIEEKKELENILDGLKTLAAKITTSTNTSNTATMNTFVSTLTSNLDSFTSLNEIVKEYSQSIQEQGTPESLKITQNISTSLVASLDQDKDKFLQTIISVFPVDKEGIMERNEYLIKSIESTDENTLKDILSIISKTNPEENLMIESFLFKYYLTVSEKDYEEKELELIKKIKELDILEGLDNNTTYEDVQEKFYAYSSTLLVKSTLDSKEKTWISDLTTNINALSLGRREYRQSPLKLILSYWEMVSEGGEKDDYTVVLEQIGTNINEIMPIVKIQKAGNMVIETFLINRENIGTKMRDSISNFDSVLRGNIDLTMVKTIMLPFLVKIESLVGVEEKKAVSDLIVKVKALGG